MRWGGGWNGVEGGKGDCSPGIAIMVKPNPRFLDKDNVCCLVCEVKESLHNICRFCCIVLGKEYGLVGPV